MFYFGRCGGILQPCSGITTDSPGKGKFGRVYARIVEMSHQQKRGAHTYSTFLFFKGCDNLSLH